jgi:pimeloyl-ACP methyl ester carboxylesterase
MEKTVCYIFSGLGADERAFDRIDFGPFSPVFIPWEPVAPNQSFESYMLQLSKSVKSPDPILAGLSFGGIVAQEMSALFGNCPVLIISSVQTRLELTPFMRFSGKIGLDRLIPIKQVLKNRKINHWLFGTKTEDEQQMLNQILEDSDPAFTKWAIHQISNWKRREKIPARVIQIHGDTDRIFPVGNLNPDYIVPGGTHFMVVSKHKEVSRVIQEALERLSNS